MTQEPLYHPKSVPMRLAIFMSNSGTNAKRIIEAYIKQRDHGKPSFEPVLIFTDNLNSNAFRIAQHDYKENGLVIPVCSFPIKPFYEKFGCKELRDLNVRAEYDKEIKKVLERNNIDSVVLADYDWIVTEAIHERFVTVNVHPADLRVKDAKGKPKYTGLGWIPVAKAILDGNNDVYATVHLVTSEPDEGAILAVSDPQPVPKEVLGLEDRTKLLGEAASIGEIVDFIKQNPALTSEMISKRFPIYRHAIDCQERLKVNGDWVIFPKVIDDIARGNYAKDGSKLSNALVEVPGC